MMLCTAKQHFLRRSSPGYHKEINYKFIKTSKANWGKHELMHEPVFFTIT